MVVIRRVGKRTGFQKETNRDHINTWMLLEFILDVKGLSYASDETQMRPMRL